MTRVHGEQIETGTIPADALDLTAVIETLNAVGIVVSNPSFTLVIETGAGLATANTYVGINDAQIYASKRGVSLGTDGTSIATMLICASDYIDSREMAFQGVRSTATQALCWPRSGVCLFDDDVVSTSIPQRVKDAQIELVMALSQNVTIMANSDVKIKREKLREVECEYFNERPSAQLPRVSRLLSPLYKSYGYSGLVICR